MSCTVWGNWLSVTCVYSCLPFLLLLLSSSILLLSPLSSSLLCHQVHSSMLAEVDHSWTAHCSVCIEVHGHACEIEPSTASRGSSSSFHTTPHSTGPHATGPTLAGCSRKDLPSRPAMILEVWSVQVISMTRYSISCLVAV